MSRRERVELEGGGLLILLRGWLDPNESERVFADLRRNVPWVQRSVRMLGKTHPEPRLTAWFGDPEAQYTYSGIELVPLPWTPLLADLRGRVSNEVATELGTNEAFRFNSVLANYYRSGQDSMGLHADAERELGQNPVIASLSLGTTRRFVMKYSKGSGPPRVELDLEGGSLLLMLGTTQHFWKHGVPKRPNLTGERYNLTFRLIRRK